MIYARDESFTRVHKVSLTELFGRRAALRFGVCLQKVNSAIHCIQNLVIIHS